MWFNFAHLFSVSLLPLATAWMAVSKLAPQPVGAQDVQCVAGLRVLEPDQVHVFFDGRIVESGVQAESIPVTAHGAQVVRP